MYILYKPKDISLIYIITMSDPFTTPTIEDLSKMTLVQIMNRMNHYRELIVWSFRNELELKKKMAKLTKPKRKQINATKSDLQRWLDLTECTLMKVIETNYNDAEPYEVQDIINSMFDVADGRYNKGLRPGFRGVRLTGYPDKVDSDED